MALRGAGTEHQYPYASFRTQSIGFAKVISQVRCMASEKDNCAPKKSELFQEAGSRFLPVPGTNQIPMVR